MTRRRFPQAPRQLFESTVLFGGEIVYDETNKRYYGGDDTTVGGIPLGSGGGGGGGGTLSVSARANGAALNSNIDTGGGTDDTAAIQAIIDAPRLPGQTLEIVFDGVALVSGLVLRSNTTIRGVSGAGFFLKSGSDQAVFRNANMPVGSARNSLASIVDRNISIIGVAINGNQGGQAHRTVDYWVCGLRLHGVRNLRIYDVDLKNSRTFGYHISCAENLHMRGGSTVVPIPGSTPEKLNQDSIHLNGPVNHFVIEGMRLSSWDDAIALNADDGPYDLGSATGVPAGQDHWWKHVGAGPITNGTIRDIFLDNCLAGLRLLSKISRIDNVHFDNIFGNTYYKWLEISQYPDGSAENAAAIGDVGHVSFTNCDVQQIWTGYGSLYSAPAYQMASIFVRVKVERLRIDATRTRSGADGQYGFMVFENHAEIDHLDVKVRAHDKGAMTLQGGIIVFVDAIIRHAKIDAVLLREATVNTAQGSIIHAKGAGTNIGTIELSGYAERLSNVVAHQAGTIGRILYRFENALAPTATDQGGLYWLPAGIASADLNFGTSQSARKVVGANAINAKVVAAAIESAMWDINATTFAFTQIKKSAVFGTPVRNSGGVYTIPLNEKVYNYAILLTTREPGRTLHYVTGTNENQIVINAYLGGSLADVTSISVAILR